MASVLMYGGYAFDDSEVALQIMRRSQYGPRGTRTSVVHDWVITGSKCWMSGVRQDRKSVV